MSTRITIVFCAVIFVLGCGPTYPIPVPNDSLDGKMAYEASVLAALERLKKTHSISEPRLRATGGISNATITQIAKDRFQVNARISSFNADKDQSFNFKYECILVRRDNAFHCEGVFIGEGYFSTW